MHEQQVTAEKHDSCEQTLQERTIVEQPNHLLGSGDQSPTVLGMDTKHRHRPRHMRRSEPLVTKRDVVNALLNGLVGLVATVVGGLIVVVLEHCLY